MAALIAFGVNHYLQLPQGYWIAFTAMLVVQQSVGGSVKAVVERMMGTFAGAAWGAIVSSTISHDPLYFTLAVIAGIAPAAFLAALYPSFRIAPITVAIVLFADKAIPMSPVQYAEHRVLEIGIGCLIGLIVALCVLPSRAHKAIAKSAAEVLESYAGLLMHLADVAAGKTPYAGGDVKHAEIRAVITKMETQAEDAKRERQSRLTDEPDIDPLLRMIRRIRFDLVMIGRAVAHSLPGPVGAALLAPFAQAAHQSAEMLRATSVALDKQKTVKPPPALDASYAAFAASLSSLHRNHALATLSETEMGRVFALSFTLEHLKQNLHDLAARVSEFGDDGKKE